jgi:hypothetical protein
LGEPGGFGNVLKWQDLTRGRNLRMCWRKRTDIKTERGCPQLIENPGSVHLDSTVVCFVRAAPETRAPVFGQYAFAPHRWM